jgi:molybdopterin synthase catalytic subunit
MHEDVDSILLGADPLDLAAAWEAAADDRAGAVDLFIGTTRRFTAGRETLRLEYEAFGSMALSEMRRIVMDARSRWEILRCVVHHRIGTVAVGEPSVIIAVSAGHRAEAFEACRFLIDTLKREVPIWKRESFADGTSEWVGGEAPAGPA